jgi:dienelactone hydrolase
LATSSQAAATGESERAAMQSTRPAESRRQKAQSESSGGKTAKGGMIGVLVVVALVGFRAYNGYQRNQARQQNQRATVTPGRPPFSIPSPRSKTTANPRRPVWTMPAMSDPGPGIEIEPRIQFHEVKIGPTGGAPDRLPGHRGKLWLYLPSGTLRPKSLPCILIAGAGSNLITGMDLGDGDRPEHLPYVRAGFAVIAYDLDGALSNPANRQELFESIGAFARARAGLVNARVAIEFATTRVPAIDPKRIYAVGHSSAATLALLIAENEPRAAACVAFAPAADLAIQYNSQAQTELTRAVPAAAALFTSLNPRTGEAKIKCPVFLFYADDDARFASQDRDLGDRLAAAGKKVTVEHVPLGGHYESMIREGVPRAIQWLKALPRG